MRLGKAEKGGAYTNYFPPIYNLFNFQAAERIDKGRLR